MFCLDVEGGGRGGGEGGSEDSFWGGGVEGGGWMKKHPILIFTLNHLVAGSEEIQFYLKFSIFTICKPCQYYIWKGCQRNSMHLIILSTF